MEVKLALNHWALAIETHNTNFPETQHECTDISACDPRRYPSTDILITSPECTNHSLAKGQKQVKAQMDLFASGKLDPGAERSRATMWDVCRFAEFHKYNVIIVENVVDARKWVLFDPWIMAMHALGYDHKQVYLNSMHFYPCPQSRDRMYIVFWRKGNRAPQLDHTPNAHCSKCQKDVASVQSWKNPQKKYGKYRQQYIFTCPKCTMAVNPYYYAAFNAIDWSDRGERIGDRKKPLSANTTKRIKFGLNKYGRSPYIFHAAYSDQARGVVRGIEEPLFTQTTLPSQAIIQPFIINDQHSTGLECRVRGVGERMDSFPTQHHMKLVMPFMFNNSHSKSEPGSYVKPLDGNQGCQTTRQTMALCIPPIIVENKGQSNAKSSVEPLSTMTTKDYHGIITSDSFNAFMAYNYNGDQVSHITEPVDTLSTKDRVSLVHIAPNMEDCYYRMIRAREVKLGMAFDKDYVILGSQKDQVKQCGNAVTPPAMEWLVEQCVKSLM